MDHKTGKRQHPDSDLSEVTDQTHTPPAVGVDYNHSSIYFSDCNGPLPVSDDGHNNADVAPPSVRLGNLIV